MLTFKHFKFTVYKRENGEGMVVLDAHNDRDEPRREGINYLSFYFTHKEFTDLFEGRTSSCNDCGHNVRRVSEIFTFYDMDFPSAPSGVMHIPFVNLTIPAHVQGILLRVVKARLRACQPGGERLDVVLPMAARERWLRRYGQGRGRVELNIPEGHKIFFDACATNDTSGTFARCMDTLNRIAANATWRWTDVATVQLTKDWDGFYFRILRPDGRCTLNGGVINHGRDGKHDWSTHT